VRRLCTLLTRVFRNDAQRRRTTTTMCTSPSRGWTSGWCTRLITWVFSPYVLATFSILTTYEQWYSWQKGKKGGSPKGYTLGLCTLLTFLIFSVIHRYSTFLTVLAILFKTIGETPGFTHLSDRNPPLFTVILPHFWPKGAYNPA